MPAADIAYVAPRNLGWCAVCARRILRKQAIVNAADGETVHRDCAINSAISNDERGQQRQQAESKRLAGLKRRWQEQLERMN